MSTGQLLREGAAGGKQKGSGGEKLALENKQKAWKKKYAGAVKGGGGVAVNGVLEEDVVYVINKTNQIKIRSLLG